MCQRTIRTILGSVSGLNLFNSPDSRQNINSDMSQNILHSYKICCKSLFHSLNQRDGKRGFSETEQVYIICCMKLFISYFRKSELKQTWSNLYAFISKFYTAINLNRIYLM